jgi:hypothetical protein
MTLLVDPAALVRQSLALLPPALTSDSAAIQLITTALQESGFTTRQQSGNGPAHGFWQCEQGGGVAGVLSNRATRDMALALCNVRHVLPYPGSVWNALLEDDPFAGAWARLIYWADPAPLPSLQDVPGSWAYYLNNWRPGAPRPETWAPFHAQALQLWGAP